MIIDAVTEVLQEQITTSCACLLSSLLLFKKSIKGVDILRKPGLPVAIREMHELG